MRGFDWKLVAFTLVLWAPGSIALAQWTAEPGTATTAPAPPPAPPDQMVSAPPPVQQPQEQKKGLEVGFTWSLDIGVPIILDVPREVVRPGANIFFFGGADFGFFVIGGEFGLQWNPIDFNRANVFGLTGRSPLTRIHLTLPEVRFQVPDLKVILPYISGAFDMNFWNFRETAVGCGYWYCSTYAVYRFTPGFTGRAGFGFKIGQSAVLIDVGFQYSFSGKGNFFEESGWWLAPYAGVMVRRR
jgi:hypothetical protein